MPDNNKLSDKLKDNPDFLREMFFMVDTDELLKRVSESTGIELKYKTLRGWIYSYGFPKPMVRSEGRGKGVKGFYPASFAKLITDILNVKASGIPLDKAITDSLQACRFENYMSLMIYTKLLAEAYMTYSIKEDIASNKNMVIKLIKEGVAKNYEEITKGLELMKQYEESTGKRSKQILKKHPLGRYANMYVSEYLLAEQVVKYYAEIQTEISSDELQKIASEILGIIKFNDEVSAKGNKLAGLIMRHQAPEGAEKTFTV